MIADAVLVAGLDRQPCRPWIQTDNSSVPFSVQVFVDHISEIFDRFGV
jgi:hypothetical protein